MTRGGTMNKRSKLYQKKIAALTKLRAWLEAVQQAVES